jgi:hypothetical protein
MGSERYSWDHGDPVGNVGRQSSPGARLHLLRRGLIRVVAGSAASGKGAIVRRSQTELLRSPSGPQTEVPFLNCDVRFTPDSDHKQAGGISSFVPNSDSCSAQKTRHSITSSARVSSPPVRFRPSGVG